jgi:CDP-glycerol glycerophosphotransferase
MSLPYHRAVTMQELVIGIQAFDRKLYEGLVKNFFDGLVLYENGNASKAVADKIVEVIKNR